MNNDDGTVLRPNGESKIEDLPTLDAPMTAEDGESEQGMAVEDALANPPGAERYRIEGQLGQGGMATVELATDNQLNRSVAVKKLRPEFRRNQEARSRFFAEAEILAGLDHPGAIPVYESGKLPDGQDFYAMKRVQGQTLRAVLRNRESRDVKNHQSQARFMGIFERVCQTMAAAHAKGVIHRDLKPENIMVDDLGVVYVMDWGLAKQLVEQDGDAAASTHTKLGAVMGTPAYMAPEQAAGKAQEADRQADVFSLGVMLYEILTGVNPFIGESALESMKGVLYHEPEAPKKRNSRVSRALSAVCMKALDKDPFRRYRSALELAEDIRNLREFRSVSAVEPRLVDRLLNWSRRQPGLAAVAATLAGVFVVATLTFAFEASVENALVAGAYDRIAMVEDKLEDLEKQALNLVGEREEAETEDALFLAEDRLAATEARIEAAESARLVLAMAITGFTVFSPDGKAQEIIRDSILDNISEHLEVGDVHRAVAQIELALFFAGEHNPFGFDPDQLNYLRSEHLRLTGVEDPFSGR